MPERGMVTSDRVLAVLSQWLSDGDFLPSAVEPRLRDYDGEKSSFEVYIDADDPEEHEVLRGVDRINGEIVLDVSADDSSAEGRQAMLGLMAESYQHEDFLAFANDDDADRGLVLGEGVRVFDFRMASGGSWEPDGRRFRGRIEWSAVACSVAV